MKLRASSSLPCLAAPLARLAGAVLALALAAGALAAAGPAATGTIQGRVLNPANGEYVRHAVVRIQNTDTSVVSEDRGFYRIADVAPGTVTLVVTYTGYAPASATVNVAPGQIVTRDFELAGATAAGEPLTMAEFVVSSEREGNAKAIMEQRNSMDITNSVASDVFGDIAEGNVGEFLKNMPGVEVDLVQGEIRTIRLRGLDAEYTQVTMDGVSLASADANAGAAGDARAFSFEQVSLSSMSSIEVSKTISADVEASAPAGTINLRSKRAFDRSGRRVTLQANVTAFSTKFNLDESYGPDDRRARKIHPGGMLDYSDVFFNQRLGVNLNISESRAFSANSRVTNTYNYAATAADPRPIVPTNLLFIYAPRTNRRSTVNFTSDFKATPRLVLSLGLLYNYADLNNPQRSLGFATGARNTVLGDDPLLSFTTSSATASVTSNPTAIVKLGQTMTATPRFEYKAGSFTFEGRFAASESKSWYDPLHHNGSIRNVGSPSPILSGIAYTARRSSPQSVDWKIEQIAGPDMADGANFTSPALTTNDGRFARTGVYSGELVATLRTTRVLPIVWKAGMKRKFELRDFRLDTDSRIYSYNGAPTRGAWADYKSPYDFDIGSNNTTASLRSISGGTVWVPDLVRLGGLFRDHPESFTQTMSATNYYNAYIGNRRYYEETIDSAYLMSTASLGRATLRGGLRWEETETDSLQFDPRTPAELRAAGFPETNGRATTIPGLDYQYFSKPKVHYTSGYDNLFPSASLKYRLTRNLHFQFGFSSTIRRPTYRDIAGVWVINDDALTVSAPNPALQPEKSRNLSARLAYYFEPVGLFAVSGFQNNVRGLHQTNRLTAGEFGYSGGLGDLSAYEFITTTTSEREVAVRGMEWEYRQSLSFLPRPFQGLTVRASYARNTADIPKANLVPHAINAGASYTYRGFNFYANTQWRDTYRRTITGNPRSYRHRANVDLGGGYRFSQRYSFFFSARNVFNEPFVTMEQVGANPAVAQFYEVNGTNWTFGVKAVF